MANEVTVTISLAVVNGNLSLSQAPGALTFDQAAIGGRAVVVNVGTSEEDIDTTEIGTLGWCFMRNLDDTNYVQWGAKDTTMKTAGRMEAGEVACFRLEPGITLRMAANTVACEVMIVIFED